MTGPTWRDRRAVHRMNRQAAKAAPKPQTAPSHSAADPLTPGRVRGGLVRRKAAALALRSTLRWIESPVGQVVTGVTVAVVLAAVVLGSVIAALIVSAGRDA